MCAMDCLSACDVVILAGGRGTRLRSVVPDHPKAMAPVHDEPFVRYLIDQVYAFGARRIILALGFLADEVQAYLARQTWHGLEIVTSVEPQPLGTGGALRSVLPLVRAGTVLVMNGDTFSQADLCEFLGFHRAKGATASLLLTHVEEAGRYGVVETDADDQIVAYHEKARTGAGDISLGVYLMERSAIEAIPSGRPVSLEHEVFPPLCGLGLYGMRGTAPFIDIGTPESYAAAPAFFRAEAPS